MNLVYKFSCLHILHILHFQLGSRSLLIIIIITADTSSWRLTCKQWEISRKIHTFYNLSENKTWYTRAVCSDRVAADAGIRRRRQFSEQSARTGRRRNPRGWRVFPTAPESPGQHRVQYTTISCRWGGGQRPPFVVPQCPPYARSAV